jgi:hypothetical protein
MDELKAAVRGDRGLRRKNMFRMIASTKRAMGVETNPTEREVKKIVSQRKLSSFSVYPPLDHSKLPDEVKSDDQMKSQIQELNEQE